MTDAIKKDEGILVAGAGGFIGGALVRRLKQEGHTRIRAVDQKPVAQWLQSIDGVESLSLDLSVEENCRRAVVGVGIVYNFACDMGGMGFIERFRVLCLRSVLINTHLLEAAFHAEVRRYFFASSACIYNHLLQQNPNGVSLKESDAYPAFPERGYGWEKLFSEQLCEEYAAERGMATVIARFHNVYGPWGTWHGGREKAPAAICRKVIEAKDRGVDTIEVWGSGRQARSFMYIDDCIEGIARIMQCDSLIASPVNLGTSEMITIDELIDIVSDIAGVRLRKTYLPDAPVGVAGRNSDNSMIRRILDWEPSIPIRDGLVPTYQWIEEQYFLSRLCGCNGRDGTLQKAAH